MRSTGFCQKDQKLIAAHAQASPSCAGPARALRARARLRYGVSACAHAQRRGLTRTAKKAGGRRRPAAVRPLAPMSLAQPAIFYLIKLLKKFYNPKFGPSRRCRERAPVTCSLTRARALMRHLRASASTRAGASHRAAAAAPAREIRSAAPDASRTSAERRAYPSAASPGFRRRATAARRTDSAGRSLGPRSWDGTVGTLQVPPVGPARLGAIHQQKTAPCRQRAPTHRGTWCRSRWPQRRHRGQPCRGRWRA